MIATAALSALVLNDTIALLVTPVVVRSARALRVNPVPYLVAVAIAANVGSVATEVGNPQNAFIAIRSGIPFLTFSAYLLPITIVCLAVSIGLVWLVFRKDLAAPLVAVTSMPVVPLQRRGLGFTLGVTVAVSGAFLASGTPDWLPLIALAGGSFVLFFLPFLTNSTARALIAKVDWSIILFFVGLFVVLGGVRASGLSVTMKDFMKAGLPVTAATLFLSTLLIALLVPA